VLQALKDWVRENPSLYDMLWRFKRSLSSDPTAAYKFLDPLSRANRGNFYFIQIGANDGLRNDPIREFVVRDKWEGVFVEPLPYVFDLLKYNYAYLKDSNFKFVNAAISTSGEQELRFYTYDEAFLESYPVELRLKYLRKSSFDRDHLIRFLNTETANGTKKSTENAVKEISVPCLTMSSLAENYCAGRSVDLLVTDAEGHDDKIIRSIDFDRLKPRVIFFESHHLKNEKLEMKTFLDAKGYDLVEVKGDTAAIRRLA
jgi:FkbM family methyltransferase